METVEAYHESHNESLSAQPDERTTLKVLEDNFPGKCWNEVLAAGSAGQRTDAEMLQALTKLHRNLARPPNCDMVRILRHGQAHEQALRLAKDFLCDFCKSQARPKVPLPASQIELQSSISKLPSMSNIYRGGIRTKSQGSQHS